VAVDRLKGQSIIFSVVLAFAVFGIVVCIVVGGSGIRKSSATSAARRLKAWKSVWYVLRIPWVMLAYEMVQVLGFGGIVAVDGRMDSGSFAVGVVRRGVMSSCPANCLGSSGGRGMSKGLLGWVVVGRVLGKAVSRDAVVFKYCSRGVVVGVVVVCMLVSQLVHCCFIQSIIARKSYRSGRRSSKRVVCSCTMGLSLIFGVVIAIVVAVASSLLSIVWCGIVAASSLKLLATFSAPSWISGRTVAQKASSSSSPVVVVFVVVAFVVVVIGFVVVASWFSSIEFFCGIARSIVKVFTAFA